MSGWGTLVAGGKQPDVLQEVNVDTMTNTEVKCVDSCKTCNYLHLQYLDHWYYITSYIPVHHHREGQILEQGYHA